MSNPVSSEQFAAAHDAYERWTRSSHIGAFLRRTAERNAAFFLPHLRPRMTVLDAGCGPGSITLGLARAVAPGRTIGVDVDSNSLARARELAASDGCETVTFEQHHLRALPYEEASFDAVFMHFVAQHLDEPERALAELYRVLRPGGVIGVADADFDGALFWPDDPLLARSTEILARIRTSGDARIGKRLRALLVGAGFERVTAGAVAGAEGDDATTRWNGASWADRFAQEPFVAYAEASGVSTRNEMAAISAAWRAWGEQPGAFAARFTCHAIGFKP